MTDLTTEVARRARECGGAFVVVHDGASTALGRRLARDRGGLGASAVDLRGTPFAPVEKIHALLRRRAVAARTVVVACGGGPLLDAARIAAATYNGGLPVVAVATTLGAAIERGVDPVARRGTIALERPTAALFVDYEAIPKSAKDGLSTLVRNALIEGDEFFDGMETLAPHPLRKWPWESVIDHALRVDRMHAGEDRDVLLVGAPFAAALAQTHDLAPQVALALGLRAACLAGRRVAAFGEGDHLRVLAVLALLGFALHDARIDADAVLAAIPQQTRFALPHRIGDVEAGLRVPRATLRRSLARLTATPGVAEFR
ncbi:MAG: hypothetical protein NVSMB64_13380 [Candidatus Velthaea sp.]